MDFPYPPQKRDSNNNNTTTSSSLTDKPPDYKTSPTAWLAAIARAAYPPTDWLGTWEIQVTTDTAPASDDHTPCDVITVSHSGKGTHRILVTGPDETSLESPGSEAQDKEKDAAIVWQRRRACLQQQWPRHWPEDDECMGYIRGAVHVRGEIIFGEYPYPVCDPPWVTTTDNDAPPVEPWKISEDEGKARFADSLLRTRLYVGEPRNAAAKWLCAQLGLSFAKWRGIKKDWVG
ncbi:hypothetical protein BO82DRAFT_388555 [Aspergillus uvarum CBS 121591]|uniref:Uncharacterized protein n=1 Tax=Aspergillus uvarum CBS 121591 TaxID=1448315 RepID=A0A319CLE7_9EURO|nr:hypothetical protein BO82DRAFT_388555 [Aspergillus uvarum CBS 121591]PYH86376.1 hypothetical protein BO82DRAFT_388555 [Aspergillus uvarum CBS 121591]